MKLSKESIDRILGLNVGTNSYVLCFGEAEKTILIKSIIESSGGNLVSVKSIGKEKNTELRYTVIIFVGSLSEVEVIDVERILAIVGKKAKVILDLTGIKLSINRRDLTLSFMKRYNIDIIKGTEEELEAVMKVYDKFTYEENLRKSDRKIIYLARKFSTIVIESDKKYLTDGYNEFKINNIDERLITNKIFDLIYSCLIATGICNCNESGEILQSIILRLVSLNIKANYKIVSLEETINIYDFVKDVTSVNSEILEKEYNVCYYFKR